MAKQPTLPLYYNDITRTCSTWTDEEFGCYMRLLIEQWDKGFIPKDINRLKRLSTSIEMNWPLMKDKFSEIGEGKLANNHMEEIRIDKNKFSKKQSNNALKRHDTEPLAPYSEPTHEGTHSEFAKRIMLPENQLDKESIEISCKKTLTAQIIKEFNANCVNQGKEHLQYNKWRSHLANWFGKRKAEVTTPTRYKTFPDD